uniref:RRM domain-containing protein n=1 Tax=Fibrocapsa japonica TaxID=94617 RepID=A0A7S2XZV6_9STRA|mmetsp:Transcript_1690/g.2354  ORF Transcript_1690/g.2354 Transcript_1690/m.2354 type:complete len:260 (+) Transcript_1690:60-839(+)
MEEKDSRFSLENFEKEKNNEQKPLKSKAIKKKALLSKGKLAKYNEKLEKRGVVYLSRIPPFMKPAKVKHLLEQYGSIERVYLVEEDAAARKRRKRAAVGGGSRKKYVEGWVEFSDKRVARDVAASLNNTQIGGKKRDFYREDMWNIKYLKHFKWRHLTEKIAYERRVAEQRLRMEVMQARKENQAFLELVEQGKQIKGMEERKKEKGANKDPGRLSKSTSASGENRLGKKIHRKFHQTTTITQTSDNIVDAQVLKSVFG